MAVTGATTAGIKYPQSTDAVSLAADLQAISESVENKTVIKGTSSYTNDVGSGWLARGIGSSTGGGILMTNTTPAGVDDRTWGLYVRTGGDVALATYDSAFSNTGAQFVALRNGTAKTDNATIANIDAGSSKTLITKEYFNDKIYAGYSTYSPTWTAVTTNPTNYTVTAARYTVIQKTVSFYGRITANSSGFTSGSGAYSISLPLAAYATNQLAQVLFYDSSAAQYHSGYGLINGSTMERVYMGGDANGATGVVAWSASGAPVAPAANDFIIFSGTYEAA